MSFLFTKVAHLAWRGAQTEHPCAGLGGWVARLKFMWGVSRHVDHVRAWLQSGDTNGLLSSLRERPQAVGVAFWPYLHSGWTAPQRFAAIRAHYEELQGVPSLQLGVDDSVVLADLSTLVPGLRVVMDRPRWFLREGEVCINLILEKDRIYSIAFSLGRWQGGRAAYIGAIQGHGGQTVQDIEAVYKDLTKKLHGTRPRDFLVVFMQILCEVFGVEHLLAVSEACRHHRHPYFANKFKASHTTDYDAIWRDRGGQLDAPSGFFVLPSRWTPRPAEDIPAQKRAMYRRRHELVLQLKGQLES